MSYFSSVIVLSFQFSHSTIVAAYYTPKMIRIHVKT